MSRATRFLEACCGRPTDCTPVWLMRQAGRYQASYRAIRERVAFLELCKNPELAAQVTVNAVEELGVDAAILFSDILIAVEAMGAALELSERGPVLSTPVRDGNDVARLHSPDPAQELPFVLEAARLARCALDGRVPLIGFAGAPFTLACYLVEGGHSSSFTRLKTLLFSEPRTAHALLGKLARVVSDLLRAQVAAGCQAVQLFDSWAGVLAPRDYRSFALPYVQQIFAELADLQVPRILFATCSTTLLEAMREAQADVIGVDWRVELATARRLLGPGIALQGNLDPACLFLDEPSLESRVREVLAGAGTAGGHVFNLGHGVLPGTDERKVRWLVETVHRLTAATRPS